MRRIDLNKGTFGAAVFAGVEELDEATLALGWNIKYGQLGKRDFSAGFASVESGGIYLTSEHLNNHLTIRSEPPEGTVGIFSPALSHGMHSSADRNRPLRNSSSFHRYRRWSS